MYFQRKASPRTLVGWTACHLAALWWPDWRASLPGRPAWCLHLRGRRGGTAPSSASTARTTLPGCQTSISPSIGHDLLHLRNGKVFANMLQITTNAMFLKMCTVKIINVYLKNETCVTSVNMCFMLMPSKILKYFRGYQQKNQPSTAMLPFWQTGYWVVGTLCHRLQIKAFCC